MKTFSKHLRQFAVTIGMALCGISGSGALIPANALSFNFSRDPQMDARAVAGFERAGALWSSALTDNVTVNIAIGFADLSTSNPGAIGLSASNQVTFPDYSTIYNALKSDRTSTADYTAVASLSDTSTYNRLINYTSDNAGSATPYLNRGSAVTITTANGKALGFSDASLLLTPDRVDASITFASNYPWDFAHGTQIAANSYDFVGVAAHEIGHALGFISGVDRLASNRGTQSADKLSVTTLDLFRYSTDSKTQGAIDSTLSSTDKYFSIDRGATKITSVETGLGYEASHWLNTKGIGVLKPTFVNGELQTITENDLLALDAIGWDRQTATSTVGGGSNQAVGLVSNTLLSSNSAVSVPEPADYLGTLMVVAFGIGLKINHRQRLVAECERSTTVNAKSS